MFNLVVQYAYRMCEIIIKTGNIWTSSLFVDNSHRNILLIKNQNRISCLDLQTTKEEKVNNLFPWHVFAYLHKLFPNKPSTYMQKGVTSFCSMLFQKRFSFSKIELQIVISRILLSQIFYLNPVLLIVSKDYMLILSKKSVLINYFRCPLINVNINE